MDAHLYSLNHHHQMSYQHQQLLANQQRATNTNNRSHYSNRQQATASLQKPATNLQGQQHQQQQQQNPQKHQKHQQQLSSSSGAASSGSDAEEQLQLSSLSTVTNKTTSSSQAAMLGSGSHASKTALGFVSSNHQHQLHQHQQQHQQYLASMQKQRVGAHQVAAAATTGPNGHRQAALQSHTLTTGANGKSATGATTGGGPPTNGFHHTGSNGKSHSDNMTSTSSSDHTMDELHQLAHGLGHHRHHHHHHQLTAGPSASRLLDSSGSQSGGRFLLGVLFTLAEMLLFATVFLWLYWSYQHDDGLAWQNDRKQQFNTHAALMLLGFIFLSGQAMLIHRSFQCCSKIYTKILHTILFVLATSAISLGLILAYTAQENVGPNNKPIMHFYSLHAWVGLTTVALFVFQFVFGFVSFLILLCCDQATSKYRAALLPIHRTFGLIIFSLAISTCLTGLLQTARSRLSSKLNKIDYHELAESGIVINLIGVCLICLAILMPYIIRNLDIKRPFRSELDRHLKLSQLDMRI